MNFLSGRGAEELTVYSWNTKVSAPLSNRQNIYLPHLQVFDNVALFQEYLGYQESSLAL